MRAPAPTVAVADPRTFLPGVWQIDRQVHDGRAREDGRFTGTATFLLQDQGLSWVERGTLRLGTFEGSATRTMAIVPARSGPAPWEVRFDDGRPFHPLDLRGGSCPVDHPCGEDHYAGWVRVEHEGLMVVSWRVTGPTKDHTILTRYTR
ncbi:DUF6314 family protein [Patulibacter minatonensis]|uniref:DUF6314 family protein n=1 Tax=Patulibacter minatonensis TaxID=298163 RepID=UPI00047E0F52|nr:DUF6314 family protein [Patulibacter minatonensis]